MESSSSSSAAARAHVEQIRRERFFIGREEKNPLAEDIHQAVTYLSEELYSKDVHFLMELIQVRTVLSTAPALPQQYLLHSYNHTMMVMKMHLQSS
jgi:sacsin